MSKPADDNEFVDYDEDVDAVQETKPTDEKDVTKKWVYWIFRIYKSTFFQCIRIAQPHSISLLLHRGGHYVGIHTSNFRDFILKPELLRAVVDCGFEHPSEG